MNWIFPALFIISIVTAAFTGTMPQVKSAAISSAGTAVELAIGLIGQMTLWLGLVGVLRESGIMGSLVRGLRPLMSRLFPEVPPDHPAMGAMIMNMAANLLGLGNAATPLGLKAMRELDKLNARPGVATNSMALFLTINTCGLALLPVSAIGFRAAAGSKDPAGIIVPTLLATLMSTIVAVFVVKLLERRAMFAADRFATSELDASATRAPDAAALEKAEALAADLPTPEPWRRVVMLGIGLAIVVALVRHVIAELGGCTAESASALCLGATSPATPAAGFDVFRLVLSDWLLPLLILAIVALGFGRKVKVYEAFVASAKEGFQTVVGVIPFLVGMLVAVGMLRASGVMGVMVKGLSPLVAPFGFPPEALPMVLIRPLSGSGALGVMTDALKAYGPDSFLGYLISVLSGSTETTFYVLALYFGAVQVKAFRHTMPACLVADVVGPMGAFFVCKLFFSAAPYLMAK